MADPAKGTDTSSGSPADTALYDSPADATKSVNSSYDYWSGNLTTSSLQMNYALIGANWAVFGSTSGILGNCWAKWSMLLVIIALGLNALGSMALTKLLRSRIEYAESDYNRWAVQFKDNYGKKSTWPFTDSIDGIGSGMRWLKASLTLASGILLIIGAILK